MNAASSPMPYASPPRAVATFAAAFGSWPAAAAAQGGRAGDEGHDTPKLEIYGFGQGDFVVDFKRNNPDWFDVNRPSRLPVQPERIRRERPLLAQRASEPLRREGHDARRGDGDVFATFDFDLFGVGIDAGQTTIRLRHAYGTVGATSAAASSRARSWTSTSSRTSSSTGDRTA